MRPGQTARTTLCRATMEASVDKQADNNERPESAKTPQTPAAADVHNNLPTFFKTLAASLAADRARMGGDKKTGAAERRHPAQRASKAALAKQARDIEKAKKARGDASGVKKTRVPLLAAAAAILIVSGVMAAMPKSSDPLPDALMGVWESTSERYSDRSFELQVDLVTFQQGVDEFTTHPITGLEATPEDGGTIYVLRYDIGETEYDFSFVHQPDEGLIRFKNQPQIKWYKK